MTARRTLAVLAAVAVAPMLSATLLAVPAEAHGALTNPISRAAACGADDSPYLRTALCQAARAAGGGGPIDWPNLRLPNVAGRDREVVPDGKLCSGGKRAFAGLDMVRRDWPTTRLTSGARFSFAYGETIPHQGGFRLYVTKDGYQGSQPLRWSDLESAPFLTVTDPPLRNEAYRFSGRLPAGKTGRHVIYTIWQNTSTADTYYSCSDVVFTRAVAGAAPAASPSAPAPDPVATAASEPAAPVLPASPTEAPPSEPAPTPVAVASKGGNSSTLPLAVGGAAAALALAGIAVTAALRRRRL